MSTADATPFRLESAYAPAGDQPAAIAALVDGLQQGLAHQTLLGVTGSGKTYTVANIIQTVQAAPVGLLGELSSSKRVFGVMARSSCSGEIL